MAASILDVGFDIFSASWGLDDAVTIAAALPEPAKSLVEERVAAWRPHQGTFKKRPWFQEAGDHSRSKQIQLEQAGVLRGYRDAAHRRVAGPGRRSVSVSNPQYSTVGARRRQAATAAEHGRPQTPEAEAAAAAADRSRAARPRAGQRKTSSRSHSSPRGGRSRFVTNPVRQRPLSRMSRRPLSGKRCAIDDPNIGECIVSYNSCIGRARRATALSSKRSRWLIPAPSSTRRATSCVASRSRFSRAA